MGEKILIQSQRLYVRTWKQSDLDMLYHVMSQPRTHLYTQEDPWSREYTQSWLEWHLDHRIGWEVGTFNCPLILRATDQLIGNVGLNPFLKDERIPEIEWQIGPDVRTGSPRPFVVLPFKETISPPTLAFDSLPTDDLPFHLYRLLSHDRFQEMKGELQTKHGTVLGEVGREKTRCQRDELSSAHDDSSKASPAL